ncbi:MAG: DUF1549 domain-containing protein, partial [Pirellulales bacterium]|nr:DUF1549 domain-containing protein [Pirellulales bacterium]
MPGKFPPQNRIVPADNFADMIRVLFGIPLTLWSLVTLAGDVSVESKHSSSKSIEFSVDVMSVLSKAGCNAGTCHGNLNGKGGLKLSLRGEDPAHDYRSLVFASRGRRVNSTAPELSLLLRKATGNAAHRGGIRFGEDSTEYQVLLDWLRGGVKGPSPQAPTVVRLQVEPTEAIVMAPQQDLQVRVQAFFSDGTSRDVTRRACYELSNLNASVSADGMVTGRKFGETTLIVRYLQQQLPVPIAFIENRPDFQWNDPPVNNEVDVHVYAKLKRLRVNPSPLCGDHVFVRRAYLDAIGRLPTAAEAKNFTSDDRVDKRARLIDHLLARDEFADFWALKFADVLRTEEKVLDTKGVEVFHAWIRDSLAKARPLDQFVRDLVTGTGSTYQHPPANYYR